MKSRSLLLRSTIALVAVVSLTPFVAARQTASGAKRMTTASAVRVRSAPNTSASVVDTLSIAVVLDEVGRSPAPQRVGDKEDYWYHVALPGGKQGWVFGGLTRAVDPNRLDEAYAAIAKERTALEAEALTWADWTDLAMALGKAAGSVRDRESRGAVELGRLVALSRAVQTIPYEKQDSAPYKPWIKAQGDAIVYSEPAGAFLVRADLFWDLQKKYADLPIGEQIAWEGSHTMLPGECEGYIPCHLYDLSETTSHYLKVYPNGPRASQVLDETIEYLQPMVDSLSTEETGYTLPFEDSELVEMKKTIAELEQTISATSDPKREKALELLAKLDAAAKK